MHKLNKVIQVHNQLSETNIDTPFISKYKSS